MKPKTLVLATTLALVALAVAAPLAAAQDPVDPIGHKAANTLDDKANPCPSGDWTWHEGSNSLTYRCFPPPPPPY